MSAPPLPASYLALCTATDGVLREVVELHAPKPYHVRPDGSVSWWDCKGCDSGSHAEDDPEWPCSTAELIAERLGVDLRDNAYVVDGTVVDQPAIEGGR